MIGAFLLPLMLISTSPPSPQLPAIDQHFIIDSLKRELNLLRASYLTRIRSREARQQAFAIADDMAQLLELLDSYSQPPPSSTPMSEEQFRELLEAISSQYLDEDKLNVLRAAISDNTFFTVDQISRVMDRILFDRNKVKVVELMFPHAVDKENGYKLISKVLFRREKEAIADIVSRH